MPLHPPLGRPLAIHVHVILHPENLGRKPRRAVPTLRGGMNPEVLDQVPRSLDSVDLTGTLLTVGARVLFGYWWSLPRLHRFPVCRL